MKPARSFDSNPHKGQAGRPNGDRRKLAVRLYEEKQHAVRQICGMMNISRPTLYKYMAAMKS